MPRFLLAGFQKCGTTDIYNRSIRHSDIMGPKGDMKEPHFLNRYQSQMGVKQYVDLFQDGADEILNRAGGLDNLLYALDSKIKGNEVYNPEVYTQKGGYNALVLGDYSATTFRMNYRDALAMRQFFPHIKVIFMLRDPTEVALSMYIMSKAIRSKKTGYIPCFCNRLCKLCNKNEHFAK